MKDKKNNVETTTLNAVPDEERKGWIDVALIQAGVYICVPSLLLGGILAMSMPLKDAILAGIIGYVLSAFITVATGIIGSDMGIPTCVVTSSSFGKKGARILISSIFAFAMIGWFSVQNSICGNAFSNFISVVFNVEFPVTASIIIWGIIMLITAVFGINSLKILNQVSVPALVVIFGVGCYLAFKNFGLEAINALVDQTMSILDGIVMTVSFLAVGLTCAPDFTRYQKTRKGVFASSFIGIIPAGVGLLIMGSVLTKLTGEYDLSVILTNLGIPVMGIIVLILATWTTNTTNAYSGGINLVMLFDLKDDKRAVATLAAGVLGTIMAALGIADSISGFIDWLGILFLPVAGVMLVDYWVVRKGIASNWSYKEGVDWRGILAWMIGCAVTIFVSSEFSLFIGFFATMIAFLLLVKMIPSREEERGLND